MNPVVRLAILLVAFAFAAIVLVFVSTVVTGMLAVATVPFIIELAKAIGYPAATRFVSYAFAVIGPALSATAVALPLGILVKHHSWVVGAAVGIAATLVSVFDLMSAGGFEPVFAHGGFVATVLVIQFVALILFSGLAAWLGSRIRRASGNTPPGSSPLKGIAGQPAKSVSVEDMNRVIRKAGSRQ